MVDVISVVLAVIQEVVRIADDMEEVGTQAARLARRLAGLEGPVVQMKASIEEGKNVFPERDVRRLENLVTEGLDVLQKLKARKIFGRVKNRHSDRKKFHTLTEEIKEVVMIFNFGLSVRAWDTESEGDREKDERRLLHMETMLEEQKLMHEEQKLMHEEQKKMHEDSMGHLRQGCAIGATVAQPLTVRAIYFSFYLENVNFSCSRDHNSSSRIALSWRNLEDDLPLSETLT